MIADKCNRCGKTVIKRYNSDSSDMVLTEDSFLYLCDTIRGESCRPSLSLREYYGEDKQHHYCLNCLSEVIHEWVEAMKARGPSKSIPLNHILTGNKGGVISPCPVCGR